MEFNFVAPLRAKAKFDEYGRKRQEKDKIIDSMKNNMVNMNEKIEKLERTVDRQEQHSRRNCLLLHGIAEDERENTDDFGNFK